MKPWRSTAAVAVVALLPSLVPMRAEARSAAPASDTGGPSIDHTAVGCIVAESFPRFDARFQPSNDLARVFFRAGGGPHWYFVDMSPDPRGYAGILPKPKKTTPRIEYYIEATGRSFASSRTAEYAPVVASGLGACKDKITAALLPAAKVLVHAPAGASALPAGFDAAGIVAAPAEAAGTGSSSPSGPGPGAAAAGTAAAAGGGHAGAILLGVLVAGGAAAGVIAASGKKDTPATTMCSPNAVRPTLNAAVFEPPTVSCPLGTNSPFTQQIHITGNPNTCGAVTVTGVTVMETVTAISGQAANKVGDQFSQEAPFSPPTLAPGTTLVQVKPSFVCTNGGSRFAITTSGTVTVHTSAGDVTGAVQNSFVLTN